MELRLLVLLRLWREVDRITLLWRRFASLNYLLWTRIVRISVKFFDVFILNVSNEHIDSTILIGLAK